MTAHDRGEPARQEPGHVPVHRSVHVRPAVAADCTRVTAIYNQGIRGRGATFETTERTTADLQAWFTRSAVDHPIAHPFLVAEQHGEVMGWIRASEYRPRDAYRRIAEYSVYVATEAQGRRIGDTLMSAFLSECANAGLSKLVSRIFPENTPSLALCARHGFRIVGTYERHAQLDGIWRDVVIVERLLSST